MKRLIWLRVTVYVILPLLAVALPFAIAQGKDTTTYDWYFKPNDTHQRPVLCPEATFLSNFPHAKAMGKDEKVLYLTFDAGFDNGNMGKILDTLKTKNVTATFFVDGNFVKNEPDLVARIFKEGHLLGNHSLHHADMSKLTDFERYKEEIEGWNDLVRQAGASPSTLFRFPCGRFSESALSYNEKLGLKTIFWSLAYYDWDTEKQPDPTAAKEKILSRIHNGCILLLHSVSSTNAEILPDIIDALHTQGYTFSSLDKI